MVVVYHDENSASSCNSEPGPSSSPEKMTNKRALDESSSCNTTKDVDDHNASDDDELEVLLVIQPPSPKRRLRSTPCSKKCEQTIIDEKGTDNYKDEIIEIIQSSPPTDVKISKFSEGSSQSPSRPANERKTSARVSLSQEINDRKIGETSSADSNMNEKTINQQVVGQTMTESTASLPTTTNLPIPSKQYSYRTSAYVQNLAEICYVLLWDKRWRVADAISNDIKEQYQQQPDKKNHHSSRLLQWERGDDLSAVHALSRLYDVDNVQPKKNNWVQYTKSFCRDSSFSSSQQMDHTLATKGNNDDQEKEVDDTAVLNSTENGEATNILGMEEKNAADEDEARTLHLYCRLYYRKGPWFRLDDMYNRYYAPKNEHQNDDDHHDEDTSNPSNEKSAITTPTKERKRLFFQPKQRKEGSKVRVDNDVPSQIGGKTSPTSTIIDETKIEKGLDALRVLYQDISMLLSIGLIRSFQNEEECGKTMGAVSDEGSGVIMTAEERRCLLAKLGGTRNGSGAGIIRKEQSQNPAENACITSTNSTMKNRRAHQSSPYENQVWKQMCNQQSISTKFCQNAARSTNAIDEEKIFLPVKKHANGIVLDKLATKIILAASKRDYLPASILREMKVEIISQIRHIQDTTRQNQQSLGADVIVETCFRLREAPLQSLQRCARVFLCASNGPGNMRGNGTNGWRSLVNVDGKQCHRDFPESKFVQIPSSLSWHNVAYPSLSHRFGLTSFSFMESYQNRFIFDKQDPNVSPSTAGKTNKYEDNDQFFQENIESVFCTERDFLAWECSVDIRANMDYLVEVNEMTLYQARRSAKEKSRDCKTKPSDDSDGSDDENESIESSIGDSTDQELEERKVAVDFLDVLTVEGRRMILNKLLYFPKEPTNYSNKFHCSTNKVIDEVEKDINNALLSISEVHDLKVDDTEKQSSQPKSSSITNVSKSCFDNDCERVIAVLSVIAIRVLIARHTLVSVEEVSSKLSRPWLRHMWWEGVLAYVLWDGIPILEKRGCYGLAATALEVLLFGFPQIQCPVNETGSPLNVYSPKSTTNEGNPKVMPLCPLLISRRARGKAFDRLVIDMTHIFRLQSKDLEAKVKESKKKTGAKRGRKAKAVEDIDSPQYKVRSLTARLLDKLAVSGSIPFSAIRTLARRLKMPLIEILANAPSKEAIELGLRLENEKCSDVDEEDLLTPKGYRDFVPKTDFAVANSLSKDTLKAGGRCSFVGFEAHDNDAYVAPSSLNVEELAMEFYASGRLPDSTESALHPIKGGWVGWHDEGGYVRALFRILCFDSVLGVDGSCRSCRMTTTLKKEWEDRTIFLTPYQGAPFDLHVAYSVSEAQCDESIEGSRSSFIRGFYERHRKKIEAFLTKIESSERQTLCDQVHTYVVNRLEHLGAKAINDVVLQRDLKQIRTLSMLAAGFGGKQLAAIFRCLLFDYRHYSGGLPDLLLARAMYEDSGNNAMEEGSDKTESGLVDLGDWIGESFSTEHIQEKEAAHRATFLIDRDEEFLGCDKVGDSGARSNGRWKKGLQRVAQKQKPNEPNSTELLTLPERLSLTHRGNKVQVECMFVEVKSSNDRLDSRQEDWLNILDRNGNARVCKFGKKKKKK